MKNRGYPYIVVLLKLWVLYPIPAHKIDLYVSLTFSGMYRGGDVFFLVKSTVEGDRYNYLSIFLSVGVPQFSYTCSVLHNLCVTHG